MDAFDLNKEQRFDSKKHVEHILSRFSGGDTTVACWEPGQISPDHCHPHATEIYFCYTGGGIMRTPDREIEIVPGSFVVHPPGEVHEYENGPQRTLLFRIRIGDEMVSRHRANRGVTNWTQSRDDAAYYAENPIG
jgi:quercetin dioxygenase-like cupin family protein